MIKSTIEGPLNIRNPTTLWSLSSIRSHLQFAISNNLFHCSDFEKLTSLKSQIDFNLIYAAQQFVQTRSTKHNLGFRITGGWDVYKIYSPVGMGGFHEELTKYPSNFYFDDFGYLNEWETPHELMGFSTFQDLFECVSRKFDSEKLEKVFCCPLFVFLYACQWQRHYIRLHESGSVGTKFQLERFVNNIVSKRILKRYLVVHNRNSKYCGHCTVHFDETTELDHHLSISPSCLQWSVHNL